MLRRVLALLLLFFIVLISACTKTYKNNSILVEERNSVFSGLHPASFAGKRNTVILMHGMCTHKTQWISDVTRKLGFASSVGDKPLLTNSSTDVEVYKAKWQEGENGIDFYGILYSPELNRVKKEYLCADIDQRNIKEHNYCTKPNQYTRTRASINNSLKNNFMNDCLADAMFYSGEAGMQVRQGVRDALTAIEKDSANNGSPITLMSQSLGSKVLRDALVCEDESVDVQKKQSEKAQVSGNINYLSSIQQVFLVSNQIALLNRGNTEQCKIRSEMKKNRSFRNDKKQDKGDVFDLFDLISSSKQASIRSTTGTRFNVVSFTDPNDLLSYEVHPKEYKNYPVTNIIVSNAASFMGLIANPIAVHQGYFANPDVRKLLRCGRGSNKANGCYQAGKLPKK